MAIIISDSGIVEIHQEVGNPIWVPEIPKGIVFDQSGELFATGGMSGMVRLWDAQTVSPVGPPLPHEGRLINDVAFSPDGVCRSFP